MRFLPSLGFVLALATAPARAQEAPVITLGPGDPAPEFAPEHWIKGKPINGFEPGKIYVIEFWATWCGPCIAAMPHLTELQKKHPDVTFIGISAAERPPKEGEPDWRLPYLQGFVRGKGDVIGYRIAFTPERDIPERWMRAAGQNGIPCSFVVGRHGRIEWIGHPMSLDEPLEQIIAGTWDAKAEAERLAKMRAERERNAAFAQAVAKAQAAADWDAVISLYEERISASPDDPSLRLRLYQVLAGRANRPEKAAVLGQEIFKLAQDDPMTLNELAWFIADDRTVGLRDLNLALAAAERATKLTSGKDAAILDTLARVCWEMGDRTRALELQTEAAALVGDADTPVAKEVRAALERYRKETR